jgi:hypothetical protein
LVNGLKISLGLALIFAITGNEIFQLFGFSQNLWGDISLSLLSQAAASSARESSTTPYLITWFVLALIIFIGKGYTSHLFDSNLFSSTYSRLPTDGDSNSSKIRYPALQRTFSYPDTLEFNYFDPDNLPSLVHGYSDYIFSSVQSLSAEIGFQVGKSFNNLT